MNPIDYALAYLVGSVLGEAKITVVFGRIIHGKIKAAETKMEFPVPLDTLIRKLDTFNPIKDIFNVMSYSVDLKWKENVEGYTSPDSDLRALRIWCITDAWQKLVVSGENPQPISLPMLIHRMTGCKETTNLLSREEMKKVADYARNDSSLAPATIPEGQPTHDRYY